MLIVIVSCQKKDSDLDISTTDNTSIDNTTTDDLGTIDHDINGILTLRKNRMEELLNDRMRLRKPSTLGTDYDVEEEKDIMYNFVEGEDLDAILNNAKKKKKIVKKQRKKRSK